MQWQYKCSCCGEPIKAGEEIFDSEVEGFVVCEDCVRVEPETIDTIWGTMPVGGES